MICRLLRLCYVLDLYSVPIEAYADGLRGEDLEKLCFDTFFRDTPNLPTCPASWPIWDVIDAANHHIWDVEAFFRGKVSFAGLLP